YRAVATSTARQFDELLQQQAALALRYADHEYREGETVVPASVTNSGQPVQFDVVYQIATRSNQLLYRSPGAPLATLAAGDGPGYSNTVLEGRSWRVYSLSSSATPLVIDIAEQMKYRDPVMSRTLRPGALPLLFELVLLRELIGVVQVRAFRRVRRIAAEL